MHSLTDRKGWYKQMNNEIFAETNRIIDTYIWEPNLRELLKSFIIEKKEEKSSWGAMTLYTHYMLGGSSPHIVQLAAGTELVVLALDIIDDLQDRDNESKAWMKCPPENALNGVLALLMGFVGQLGHLPGNESFRPPAEASQIIARSINGQQRDLNNRIGNVDDCLSMIQEKSGSLMRLAFYMGYAPLRCSEETIGQLNELADCIGLIHQIQNDINDLLRYDVKNDLFAKKRTVPILFMLEDNDESFVELKRYYEGSLGLDEFLLKKQACLQYIQDSGCIEYAKVVQTLCVQKADEIFGAIEALSPWKEKLREITYEAFT
ncbi:hypothetical protein DQG23_06905 [Paenibacillus contaminans]|uniref:Polyprenyl synthetase n=2 Tax=Paenibacillus contaminans TaxID=450362 RepID=A0A329MQF0_9BACL|nr:hypothetical protein DQG23_06905 [Paenibacillus contaminans]